MQVGTLIARATARRAATWWLRVLAVVSIALAGAAIAAPASAHPVLMWSDPPAGSAVPQPVDRVVLSFSEAVDIESASVELADHTGKTVAAPSSMQATKGDPTTVTALFGDWIDHGDLTVMWKVVSGVDGHLVSGAFDVRFGSLDPVSANSPIRAGALAPRSDSAPALIGAARMVGNYAVAALVGGTAFVALVWPNGLGIGALRRLLWIALAIAAAATAMSFLLLGADITGGFSALDVTAALGTRAGVLAALRFIALPAAAGPVLARLTQSGGRVARSPVWRAAAAATALALLTSVVAAGHAATGGPMRIAAGVLHFGGVAVWLGGLVVISLVVLPRRRFPEIRATLPRFSALAGTAFSAAALGGVLMARSFVGDWRTLGSSAYGHVLILKTIVVLLILSAAVASRMIVGRISGGSGRRAQLLRPLTASVATEVVLATIVLAVSAVLVSRPLPTPMERIARASSTTGTTP